MPNHAYRAASAPSVVQRARNTRTGRKLERGGYLTVETVTMWIVYALTLIGNAVIEGGRVGGTTSADIAYGVFTWFTPAGYVFAIWSLIYVAMVVWLVAYTRTAPVRADRFTMTSILFIASCALNVLWLALWHFELVAVSFIVILAEWLVLAALYLNVRRTMKTASGRVPVSIYTAWVTVATLANMAILVTRALDGGIPFFNGLFTILLTAGVRVRLRDAQGLRRHGVPARVPVGAHRRGRERVGRVGVHGGCRVLAVRGRSYLDVRPHRLDAEARAAELAILQHARGEKVRLGGAVRPQKASSPAKPADRFSHFR